MIKNTRNALVHAPIDREGKKERMEKAMEEIDAAVWYLRLEM